MVLRNLSQKRLHEDEIMWRWDQGRLLYFQFDVLKAIAKTLVKFDNADISIIEPTFRQTLMDNTGMPFAPNHYTVKRNYSRVFQCAFLATFLENRLVVTDICQELAKDDGAIGDVDDYFFNYINRFRFPFPAFDNYDSTSPRIYPFCAIIKLLLAKRLNEEESKLSVDDIFHYLVANNTTGCESIEYYKTLKPVKYDVQDTERRQIREMLIFLSQLSILKVNAGYLHLDIVSDNAINELLGKFLNPIKKESLPQKTEEYLSMANLVDKIVVPAFEIFTSDIIDIEFIEGKRKRVEHFKVERSPLLRKYFIEQSKQPVCSACDTDMSMRYPWTEYMLDIHHLLPLSSSVAITNRGTSLSDIVGLCPSCHRAVHIYYRQWLLSNHQDDFNSKMEAKEVFIEAVKEIA